MYRPKDKREVHKQDGNKGKSGNGNMYREDVSERLLQVVENPAPHGVTGNDRCKIVVKQNE